MNYIRKLAGIEPKAQEESWRVKLAASSANVNTPDEPDNFPLRFYILSFDTLCGRVIDQKLPPGWSEKPPLFPGQNDSERQLKAMCRGGIPPALRSAVWLTSVVRVARPLQSKEETDEFGTLAKVQVLEYGWNCVLDGLFPDESDKEAATIPDFGVESQEVRESIVQDHMTENGKICDKKESGLKSLTLVLYATKEYLGIEYCPLLPDLTALFLSVMPESNAYACIREMSNSSTFYFPMSKIEHLSWCKTFGVFDEKDVPADSSGHG
jgi:TBC domain.